MTLPLTTCRVLVAEDERNVRMLLRVVLEAAGATVVEAEDGARALRMLELADQPFDLLLTDLNMPEMDGAQLVHHAQLRWPELRIVVCSARTLSQAAPGLTGRVEGTILKPFVPAELVRTLAQVLSETRRIRLAVG